MPHTGTVTTTPFAPRVEAHRNRLPERHRGMGARGVDRGEHRCCRLRNRSLDRRRLSTARRYLRDRPSSRGTGDRGFVGNAAAGRKPDAVDCNGRRSGRVFWRKGHPRTAASGTSAGRRDLVEAARQQMSPNHAVGRTCKVGKEEAVGLATALELYVQRDHAGEMAAWYDQAHTIVEAVKRPPASYRVVGETNRHAVPTAIVAFDRGWRGATPGDVAARLKAGAIRRFTSAMGQRKSRSMPIVWSPGDAEIVSKRLLEALG